MAGLKIERKPVNKRGDQASSRCRKKKRVGSGRSIYSKHTKKQWVLIEQSSENSLIMFQITHCN